ncbi:MAG TPA: Ig-like domain-containing protein, partial [Verrucomicrobiae bacterium]|nr:Ig-like domain-containing protein [Verrucomicrobiae bacterium]
MRSILRMAAVGCLSLLSAFAPPEAQAAGFDARLQGQSSNSTTWINANLMGWGELDLIPCRVYITGGPANSKTISVDFNHFKGTTPGIENLTGWTTSPNVVFIAPPVLIAPILSGTWTYTFTVNITDRNPGWVEFRARLSAGAHLNTGSSLALSGKPSLGTLQFHKPDPGMGLPDLSILKRGPANAMPGETITYTMQWTNKAFSPSAALGVQITDILPPEVSYVTNSASGGAVLVGNVLIWDLGDLAIGAQGSVTYKATVKPGVTYGTTFQNYAQILCSQNDAYPADNASAVTTTVVFNRAPIANDDVYSVNEDELLTVPAPGVLANDTDLDGNPLLIGTPRPVSAPAHGTLTLNPDGSFTYQPAANYNGLDNFTYLITDGAATSAVATVTITVNPVNDSPVANDDAFTANEDMPLTIPASGVLFNDTDVDGDTLAAAVLTGPSHGTLTLNSDGSFTYTPAANYHGPDSFTYRASDGSASATATANITVRPVNDPPVSADDAYATDEDTALIIAAPGVLANDSDLDGDTLTAAVVTGPSHGTLTLNGDGSFAYTPAANYHGPDSFTYRASDGSADATAAASITVRPVNDPPVSADDTYATDEDAALTIAAPGVLANDSDLDGDTLTAAVVTGPSHGT